MMDDTAPVSAAFPPAPPGKASWPWIRQGNQSPGTMPCGDPWPKVTIITPSFNQGEFIEETIRSVLLQDYPNLEYIIIDGGSTDSSVQIIRSYAPWLAYWETQKDRGQAHAINKGIERSTGSILAWLNSDDVYLSPSAVSRAVLALQAYPATYAVTGSGVFIDDEGRWLNTIILDQTRVSSYWFMHIDMILQPATFFRREVFTSIRCDENLHYTFDWDLFARISKQYNFLPVSDVLAGYRWQKSKSNKTQSGGLKRAKEIKVVTQRYLGRRCWQALLISLYVLMYSCAQRLPPGYRSKVELLIRKLSLQVSQLLSRKVASA